MFPKTITKEEIVNYPIIKYPGKTLVADTPGGISQALDYLKDDTLLGFDTESKPVFRKGQKTDVALIQLAGKDMVCLIRINKTGFPDELADFLNREEVTKVGAGLGDDFLRLYAMGVELNRYLFIDLGEYLRDYDFEKTGLRNLSAMILKKRVTKREQTSNWEADKLSSTQIVYAATDAWICREIYLKLIKNGY